MGYIVVNYLQPIIDYLNERPRLRDLFRRSPEVAGLIEKLKEPVNNGESADLTPIVPELRLSLDRIAQLGSPFHIIAALESPDAETALNLSSGNFTSKRKNT